MEERLLVPISTSRARRMEIALYKASVTVQLQKNMLFLSLTELMPNRLRQILSRPVRNSSVGIGAASEHQRLLMRRRELLRVKRVGIPPVRGFRATTNPPD
jgi:hypothetical protein